MGFLIDETCGGLLSTCASEQTPGHLRGESRVDSDSSDGGGNRRMSSAKLISESLDGIRDHRANVEGLMDNIRSMISERSCDDLCSSLAKIQQERVRIDEFVASIDDNFDGTPNSKGAVVDGCKRRKTELDKKVRSLFGSPN
jgi:hypothetical protein